MQRKPYKLLNLPFVRLGRSVKYTAPDYARWALGRRSKPATEQEISEMIEALGGADQLLDEKEVSRKSGLSVATLQTDRCRSAKVEAA